MPKPVLYMSEFIADNGESLKMTNDPNDAAANTTVVKDAILKAKNGGYTTIIFPTGSFFSHEIDIDGSQNSLEYGLRLIGTETKWNFAVPNTPPTYHAMLDFQNCNDIHVEGFRFYGNNSTISGGVAAIKLFGFNTKIRIVNNYFQGAVIQVSEDDYPESTDINYLSCTHLDISDNTFFTEPPFTQNDANFQSNQMVTFFARVEHFRLCRNRFYCNDVGGSFLAGSKPKYGLIQDNYSEWGYDSEFYTRGYHIDFIGNEVRYCGKDAMKNVGLEFGNVQDAGHCRFINNKIYGAGRRVAGSPVGINIEGDPNQGGGNYLVEGNHFYGVDPTLELENGIPQTGGIPWTNSNLGMIGINVFTSNVTIANNHFYGNNSQFTSPPNLYAFGVGVAIKTADVLNVPGPIIPQLSFTEQDGFIDIHHNKFHDMRQALLITGPSGGITFDYNFCKDISDKTLQKYGNKGTELTIRNNRFIKCNYPLHITNQDLLIAENNLYTDSTGDYQKTTNVDRFWEFNNIIPGNAGTPRFAGVKTDFGGTNGRIRVVIDQPRVSDHIFGEWEDASDT